MLRIWPRLSASKACNSPLSTDTEAGSFATLSCITDLPVPAAGIQLDLVIPPQQSAPRIEAAEELGAIGLLQAYAEGMDMTPDAAAVGMELLRVRCGSRVLPHNRSKRCACQLMQHGWSA